MQGLVELVDAKEGEQEQSKMPGRALSSPQSAGWEDFLAEIVSASLTSPPITCRL